MGELSNPEAPQGWPLFLGKIAIFIYGFFLGVITSYLGNWAWEKFRPRKKEPHLSLEYDEQGTSFTGRFGKERNENILRLLLASAAKPYKKKRIGTEYMPPGDSTSA